MYLSVYIHRRINTNDRVFINESRNWIFLNEIGLQQQFTVRTHKIGGILDQFITSEDVEVSESLANFLTSSDHEVMHFELLQTHEYLAIKKVSCRNWQHFNVEEFAEIIVARIDRNNPENVWNSLLMNEVSYFDKNHPLKTEYVRNHTCPFFADELHEKIEKKV